MLRDHSNKWKQKHTSFWWKPLGTNHKLPHSSTLIVFLRENELFQRGWGVFVTLVEIPKGWGVISSLQKWKIQGGGGVLSEIPSVVGVWIFSGTTHCKRIPLFVKMKLIPSVLHSKSWLIMQFNRNKWQKVRAWGGGWGWGFNCLCWPWCGALGGDIWIFLHPTCTRIN